MGYYDGRGLLAHEAAVAQTCDRCDARGVTLRAGALLCIGHAA